jgi:hypothetical protein
LQDGRIVQIESIDGSKYKGREMIKREYEHVFDQLPFHLCGVWKTDGDLGSEVQFRRGDVVGKAVKLPNHLVEIPAVILREG